MAFPSSGGGVQVGDGNLSEPVLLVIPTPQAATTTVTLTAAQFTGGMLVATAGAVAASYTLPTVDQIEALLVNVKVGSGVELKVTNLGTASGVVTFLTNTGWTLVGNMAIAITSSAQFIARKTAVGAWTLYRVA